MALPHTLTFKLTPTLTLADTDTGTGTDTDTDTDTGTETRTDTTVDTYTDTDRAATSARQLLRGSGIGRSGLGESVPRQGHWS